MRIENNVLNLSCSYENTVKGKENEDFFITESKKNNKTPENEKKSSIWENFNPRSAKFSELCERSTKLYEQGEISLFHHALLTFDPTSLNDHIKNLPGSNDIRFNKTDKVDWINDFEEKAKKCLEYGDMMSYKNNMDVVDILKKFKITN